MNKIVNGVEVQMSPEEANMIQTEWNSNLSKPKVDILLESISSILQRIENRLTTLEEKVK